MRAQGGVRKETSTAAAMAAAASAGSSPDATTPVIRILMVEGVHRPEDARRHVPGLRWHLIPSSNACADDPMQQSVLSLLFAKGNELSALRRRGVALGSARRATSLALTTCCSVACAAGRQGICSLGCDHGELGHGGARVRSALPV